MIFPQSNTEKSSQNRLCFINGLARRADSATQSQFSVHFSTKTTDFFRSEFLRCFDPKRIRSRCEGVGIRSFSQSYSRLLFAKQVV